MTKDFGAAIKSFRKAIKFKPDFSKAYNNLGNRFLSGKLQPCHVIKAIKFDRKTGTAILNLNSLNTQVKSENKYRASTFNS